MFKLNPNPTFEVPVQLSVPGQDSPETIRVTFRHKPAEGLAAWYADYAKKPAKDGLLEVIEGWSGVVDDKGEQVQFNAEVLDKLLHGYATASRELVSAYVTALTESRTKN